MKMKPGINRSVKVWVGRGGEKVDESLVEARSDDEDPRTDNASMVVAMQLTVGDEVALYMETTANIDELNYITFCVSSVSI
jgi:hypothetical protein